MPLDTPTPESPREQGCRLACEGILRSQFGRRPSNAVSKALERIELEEREGRIIPLPETDVSRRPFTPAALALAAGIALLLGLGGWFFGPTMGQPSLEEGRGRHA